jgi:hypothetical protein
MESKMNGLFTLLELPIADLRKELLMSNQTVEEVEALTQDGVDNDV